MEMMNIDETERSKILELLRDDEHYYGDFGKKFLSNSDIGALLNNPQDFKKSFTENIHLVMGGAFHTMILEPEKYEDNYPRINSSSRQTNKYKSEVEAYGKMTLLEQEHEHLLKMKKKIDENETIQSILKGDNVEYEVPAFGDICGEMWKGKADIVNHDDKLVIDLKTTSDLAKFHLSAQRYNYNSQAYIYREFFGYDFCFVVIDKKTLNLGFYDCSDNFYKAGKEKVVEAVHAYRMFFKDQDFDFKNYLITQTL